MLMARSDWTRRMCLEVIVERMPFIFKRLKNNLPLNFRQADSRLNQVEIHIVVPE